MAKERVRLTKALVEAAQPKDKTYPIPDGGQAGLCLQVTPAGAKSWVIRYRFQGLQKTCTLGQWPTVTVDAARTLAMDALGNLKKHGIDPNAARAETRRAALEAREAAKNRPAAVTVDDLVDRYQAEHVPDNSEGWQTESCRLMDRHIRPALGKLPLKDLGPAEVSSLLYKMKGTPTQANRTRAVLRSMFQRAEEWGLRPLGTNPVSVVKMRGQETKRTRRLSDLELKKLGEALRASSELPELKAGLRLALMAGMRKGEIQGCLWEWVDLQAGTITIPPEEHKTGKKTGKARIVHLCPELVADLQAITRTLGCPHLIPGSSVKADDGTLQWKPFTAIQNPWERVREAAKLAVKGEPSEEDPGLHDLRRTFASVATDLGLKGFVAELLGHVEATVTDRYTRAAAERLHDAAATIGARIGGILSGAIDPEKEAEERAKAEAGKAARRA